MRDIQLGQIDLYHLYFPALSVCICFLGTFTLSNPGIFGISRINDILPPRIVSILTCIEIVSVQFTRLPTLSTCLFYLLLVYQLICSFLLYLLFKVIELRNVIL